jgi:beta-glucosidase
LVRGSGSSFCLFPRAGTGEFVNPSGKLTFTFPKDESQLPNWDAGGSLDYPKADEAHGYFRANKKKYEPLFWFGHGLSYTTFAYGALSITPGEITSGDRVMVSLDVTNSGTLAGEEVVELYLSLPSGKSVAVREQELRGFKKLSLAPGETKKATFQLTFRDMAYYDVGTADFDGIGEWKTLAGTYKVRVGTSSKIDQQPTVSGSFTVN